MQFLFRKLPIKHSSNLIARSQSKQAKKKVQNFVLVRPTSDDYPAILRLMHRAYYTEEPVSSSLAFRPNTVFDDSTIKCLSQGYSVIAKCKYNGDILGCCINETTHCWDPDLKDDLACKVQCVKSRQILHFFAYVQRHPDLWKKYGMHKIFEMAYLFVRRDARGKGIALRLLERSRDLAVDCRFPLVRVDASNYYTSKLCEKMQMKLVGEIPYCSYVGEDKRPIFKPPDPHKSVKIYIDDEPHKHVNKYTI